MTNETQQTAVELFIEQLEKKGDPWENSSMNQLHITIDIDDYLELKIKAKEMENEIMIKCYSDGLGNGIAVEREDCSFESVADEKEYLIKTYGGNK
jgi:hypothetical protein